MNIEENQQHIPYTYLIGWSNHNKWYYGVRFAKNCHPNELWKSYFTSSKYVKDFRKLHGEPDIIEVRRTFQKADQAVLWEEKVLSKMKVLYKGNWLNSNVAGAIYLKKFTEEHKKKISLANKGKHTAGPALIASKVAAEKNRGRKRPEHAKIMREKYRLGLLPGAYQKRGAK